jgi:hypothetical protein
LRVGGALQLSKVRRWVNGSQEDGLELVHTRIGEQKSRIRQRSDRGRGYYGPFPVSPSGGVEGHEKKESRRAPTKGVTILFEIIQEGFSDSQSGPFRPNGSHFDWRWVG